jgi:hypothetical protein
MFAIDLHSSALETCADADSRASIFADVCKPTSAELAALIRDGLQVTF